jgi:tRNA-2-methylthio-N6-dimethylallyladenosine synthase
MARSFPSQAKLVSMEEGTRTFWFATLGCKANQYDSQRLRSALAALGWAAAATPEEADLILVNT